MITNDSLSTDPAQSEVRLTKDAADLMGFWVARETRKALRDPKNRADFEKWYFERHGVKYDWNKHSA